VSVVVSKKWIAFLLVIAGGAAISWFVVGSNPQRLKDDLGVAHGDKLKPTQQEIAALDDSQLEKEVKELESIMYKDGLIKRLNQNLVTEDERTKANDILLRLALLNVERTKRTKMAAKK
jgi:hypothetical protein